MDTLKGCFLVPSAQNTDGGLWLIFHHEPDGILAFDVTRPHPDIPYRHFESVMACEDLKKAEDKIVLCGGPEQNDNALLVLHNNINNNIVNDRKPHFLIDDLGFLSYRFTLVPGHPPTLLRADDMPTQLELSARTDFLIVMGFRLWKMEELEEELKNWQWTFLPASSSILFQTSAQKRLEAARRSIN